jgi:hypothetical protein
MPNLEAWRMQQECLSRSPQVMPYLGVPWRCRPCACVKRQRQQDFLFKCNSGSHLMDYQILLQLVSISVCVRRTLLQTPHKNPLKISGLRVLIFYHLHMEKCTNNFFFILKKQYVVSIFHVIPSLGGSYEFKSEFEVFTVLSMLLCKL